MATSFSILSPYFQLKTHQGKPNMFPKPITSTALLLVSLVSLCLKKKKKKRTNVNKNPCTTLGNIRHMIHKNKASLQPAHSCHPRASAIPRSQKPVMKRKGTCPTKSS
uniref:Uncharacterized protein n=1 Tax=Theropithecus gelada TaxID=9565 RepID=A0A8D2EAT4_THEGE